MYVLIAIHRNASISIQLKTIRVEEKSANGRYRQKMDDQAFPVWAFEPGSPMFFHFFEQSICIYKGSVKHPPLACEGVM
jgi:hypothetical protein